MWQATLFRSSQAAAAANANVNIVPFTNDTPSSNSALFPNQDFFLYGAAARGATITRSLIDAASLRSVAPLQIRPVVVGATFGNNPNMAFWLDNMPQIKREEVTAVQDTNAAGAPETHDVVLFYGDGNLQVPGGRRYKLHGQSTTAATAGAWTQVQVSYDQNIAAGMYAVIGMEVLAATGVLARLAIVGTPWRPGVIPITSIGNRMFWRMYEHPFGTMGTFSTNSYPGLELFCTAADATQDVWLDLVKLS